MLSRLPFCGGLQVIIDWLWKFNGFHFQISDSVQCWQNSISRAHQSFYRNKIITAFNWSQLRHVDQAHRKNKLFPGKLALGDCQQPQELRSRPSYWLVEKFDKSQFNFDQLISIIRSANAIRAIPREELHENCKSWSFGYAAQERNRILSGKFK